MRRLDAAAHRVSRRGFAGRHAVGDRRVEAEDAPGRTGATHAIGAAIGKEGVQLLLETQLAACLREEMDGGREAAAHRHEVAGEARARADLAVAADGRDLDRGHLVPAARRANRGGFENAKPGGTGSRCPRPRHLLADVDDRRDLDAARGKLDRGAVSLVMGGRHHRARAGLDGVARKILPRRVGEHDAGAVVVGKDERAFERARREHDLLGAHLPKPLARSSFGRRRQMVRQAFDEADHVVRERAEGRGARQPFHIRRLRQRRNGIGEPGGGHLAVDRGFRFGKQRAAELRLLVAQDDAGAMGLRG